MDHTVRMQEIRVTVRAYPLHMVYNMDENGLFYRMGLNSSCLLQSEDRASVRGTELQKHKARLTAVFCVNADGSHALLIRNASKTRDLHLNVNFTDQSQKDGWVVQDSKIGLRGGMQKCKEIVLERNYLSQIIMGDTMLMLILKMYA